MMNWMSHSWRSNRYLYLHTVAKYALLALSLELSGIWVVFCRNVSTIRALMRSKKRTLGLSFQRRAGRAPASVIQLTVAHWQ